MAITLTIFQRQFDELQQEVRTLSRLFNNFRSYTNRQFISINERLDSIEENMVTRTFLIDAISGFATKDELTYAISGFATKDELTYAISGFATKEELTAVKEELCDSIAQLSVRITALTEVVQKLVERQMQ